MSTSTLRVATFTLEEIGMTTSTLRVATSTLEEIGMATSTLEEMRTATLPKGEEGGHLHLIL